MDSEPLFKVQMAWGRTKHFNTRQELIQFMGSGQFQDEHGGMFDPRVMGRLADGTWMEVKPWD